MVARLRPCSAAEGLSGAAAGAHSHASRGVALANSTTPMRPPPQPYSLSPVEETVLHQRRLPIQIVCKTCQ